jgi:hypothetical protein
MNIAIFNGFYFHFEMFGYIIDYCNKKNIKLDIYTPLNIDLGWIQFYKDILIKNDKIKFIEFTSFPAKNDYDKVILTTDDDKSIPDNIITDKYICIEEIAKLESEMSIHVELIERVKEHYFNFEIDIDYNPEDSVDKATEFFRTIMNNDDNILEYFQKISVSILCSQTEAQSIYIFWGNGSNGKLACMNLINKLDRHELDFALIALPYDTEGFLVKELFDDEFWLIAKEGDPIFNKKDLHLSHQMSDRILLLEDGHCIREHTLKACRRSELVSHNGIEATSLLTLVQMVESGLGIALLPKMAVHSGLLSNTQLIARPLAVPTPKRKIALIARPSTARIEEFNALVKVIKN